MPRVQGAVASTEPGDTRFERGAHGGKWRGPTSTGAARAYAIA